MIKIRTNCGLESVSPQQSKLLIKTWETHFMILKYKKKLVLTRFASLIMLDKWMRTVKHLVNKFKIRSSQWPRDLHHSNVFWTLQPGARSISNFRGKINRYMNSLNFSNICLYCWTQFISTFSDERDAIQKKTFTKWVNKHLKKVRI